MAQDKSIRVLVVDDIPDFLREMSAMLRPAFQVAVCSSPLRAVRLVKGGKCDLLITTLIMREMDGFEVIRRVRGSGSAIPIIMVTGYGDENTAIEATRLGANDYLNKPVLAEELIARIRRAAAPAAPPSAPARRGDLPPIVTGDPEMRRVLQLCERVADSDSRALILGETGTGKELFARALHSQSRRAKHPFVEINCAAIPSNLMESELFGHERGSFTGATERRIGRFEEASKGTLFLDEIGELGIALQSKLLRVLQTGAFNRVGGSATLTSGARVVAATNRDLDEEVRAGRFRADLYYRLNVVSFEVPPLRARFGDIPLLVEHFNRKFTPPHRSRLAFSPAALRILSAYAWPGNVRELEHLIERLAVLSTGREVQPEDLPAHYTRLAAQPRSQDHSSADYHSALLDFDREYFQRTIASSGGNLAAAARLAGLDRSQFFRKVKALGLHRGRSEGIPDVSRGDAEARRGWRFKASGCSGGLRPSNVGDRRSETAATIHLPPSCLCVFV